MERRAVVDLLSDREADRFAARLRAHPGVEVIARDRGAGYADGGRRGAPGAVHVADRWHLLENCTGAVLEAVKRNMPALRAAAKPASSAPAAAATTVVPVADPDAPPPMTSAQRLQWQGWQRRVQVHGEVMRLHQQGVFVRHIARNLALSRNTVRRWVRGKQPKLHRPRMHSLDPWRAVLERRWADGCRNGAQLWRSLRDTGFKGGMRVVTEWANRQRLGEHQCFLLGMHLRNLKAIGQDLETLDARIGTQLEPYQAQHRLLMQIPGVDWVTAASIIAEIGTDMDVFATARRLAAWAGVAPGNYESAGKPKGAGTRRGNVFLKSALFAAASAAVRTKGSYYRDKYNTAPPRS